MIELEGKYNSAKVFTDNIGDETISQIIELMNEEFTKDSKIRIMPDTHKGSGCVIGTTMTIQDKIVPNIVGVDINCGMELVRIAEKDLDLVELDEFINKFIPSGFEVRTKEHKYVKQLRLEDLKCKKNLNLDRARKSIGTLGGGNHFIEVNKDKDDNIYIVVHSGSRYLGKQVAEYYQELGYKELSSQGKEQQELIDKLKANGRYRDIQFEINKIKPTKINKSLAYIEGENFDNYINDMKIVQEYATLNRKAILDDIVNKFGFTIVEQFTTIHNYIDTDDMMLRKGAISAKKGEKVIIPINMRDGSIIAVGKGSEDWNYSAPHGAGRLMSRSKAKLNVTLEEFEKSMEGIYTTSVKESTIDESAFAYKPMEEIISNIGDTVEIIDIIRPIYNFKAN